MGNLKILKIKPWCIKFDVDGQKYFLKKADDDNIVILYKFNLTDDKGHYNTVPLGSTFSFFNLSDYISNPYKRGRTYKEIDLSQFWGQLAYDGFGEILGMCKEDIDFFVREREITRCKKRIAELENLLKEEYNKLYELQC